MRGLPSANNWKIGQRISLPKAAKTATGFSCEAEAPLVSAAEVKGFITGKLNLAKDICKRNIGTIWRVNDVINLDLGVI